MTDMANEHVAVQAAFGPGPTADTWTATFDSPSVPGALAAFAGTLAMAGFDIVSATVLARADGTLTDSFDVVPREGAATGADTAARLAERAEAAVNRTYDLSGAIAALRDRGDRAAEVDPAIDISVDSELTTGIKVTCADRPGLLYDIASTLSRHGLRCRAIAVLTFRGRAVDTFRVIDASGTPPKNEAVLEALRTDLLAVCG